MRITKATRRTMKQLSLSTTGFEKAPLRTRRREFLEEMDRVVPWAYVKVRYRGLAIARDQG